MADEATITGSPHYQGVGGEVDHDQLDAIERLRRYAAMIRLESSE
jgi:hypothetical protein